MHKKSSQQRLAHNSQWAVLTIGLGTPHGPNEWAPHLCLASNLCCWAQILVPVQYSGFNPSTMWNSNAQHCIGKGLSAVWTTAKRPTRVELPANRPKPYSPTTAMLSSVAHPLATYPQLFCQNTRRVPPATAVLKAVLPSGNLPPTILNHSLGNWKPPGRLVSLAQAMSSEQSLILLVYSILLLWP